MSERQKPFVGFMLNPHLPWGMPPDNWGKVYKEQESQRHVPVVVTPLLPDDPRSGEVWLDADGDEVTVVGPPIIGNRIPVSYLEMRPCLVHKSGLTRVPPEKTYTLPKPDAPPDIAFNDLGDLVIRAKSKEAALAKLAAALTEVEE